MFSVLNIVGQRRIFLATELDRRAIRQTHIPQPKHQRADHTACHRLIIPVLCTSELRRNQYNRHLGRLR